MDRQELLTVEHAYYIDRPGAPMLVLSPHFHMPKKWNENGWRERQEQVIVLRPDGSELPATAQISITHLNIRDPNVPIEARWPITVWLTDRTPDEVPIGSKILVQPSVRAAILGE